MKHSFAIRIGAICAAFLVNTALMREAFAEELVPPRVAMILGKADELMGAGRVREAIDLLTTFRNSGSRGHDHCRIDMALGNAFLTDGNPGEAETFYRSALDKQPDHAPAWHNLGRTLYELDEHEKAGEAFLNAYERRTEKQPEDLYDAGICFMTAGRHSQALESLERLLKDHPAEVKPQWKEAMVHACMALSMHEQALPYVRELSETVTGELRTRWRELRIHLCVVLDRMDEARECLEQWVVEEPLSPAWWKALAQVHLNQKRLEEALTALTIYGYLVPMTEQEIRLAADVALALDIPVTAVNLYETGFRESDDPEIAFRLAHALIRLQRYDEARNILAHGLMHGPDHPGLLRLKEHLDCVIGRSLSSTPDS